MKLNKISQIILYTLFVISAILGVAFFLKGIPAIDDQQTNKIAADAIESSYLNSFLQWAAILVYITLAVTFFFVIVQFVSNFIHSPKSALKSLAGLVLIAVVFLVAWSMADSTVLTIDGYTGADDTPGWMVASDTLLYGVYGLSIIALLSMLLSGVWKMLK